MRIATALALCAAVAAPGLAAPALEQLRALAGPDAATAPPKTFIEMRLAGASLEGIDPAKLDAILKKAVAEKSDAVIIMRNGKLVAAQGVLDKKIVAMSASKSVASLAVGCLIDEGRIRSLDQPVSDFYPEWRAGDKAKVTIGMLLSHTSGLDVTRGIWPDGTIAHALRSPLVFPPGTAFAYNNNAVDFLAGIIEKASGERADLYIERKLFKPLGITDWDWMKDPKGTPLTAGELLIRPLDLAKIGQMVLDGGVWKGTRVVSEGWLKLSATAAQPFNPFCGLLWWLDGGEVRSLGLTPDLFKTWLGAGVPAELAEPLRPLIGRAMKSRAEFYKAVREAFAGRLDRLDELERHLAKQRLSFFHVTEVGPNDKGFSAIGWLGQYLVIDPKRRLVGVRMRHARREDYEGGQGNADSFDDFPNMVHGLVSQSLPSPRGE